VAPDRGINSVIYLLPTIKYFVRFPLLLGGAPEGDD
jgi:hypothetical protein